MEKCKICGCNKMNKLQPNIVLNPKNWHHFAPELGQHVSTLRKLGFIISKTNRPFRVSDYVYLESTLTNNIDHIYMKNIYFIFNI
jgi:hypothetical protein